MRTHRCKEAILASPSFNLSKELNSKALLILKNFKSLCKSRCIIRKVREVEWIFEFLPETLIPQLVIKAE